MCLLTTPTKTHPHKFNYCDLLFAMPSASCCYATCMTPSLAYPLSPPSSFFFPLFSSLPPSLPWSPPSSLPPPPPSFFFFLSVTYFALSLPCVCVFFSVSPSDSWIPRWSQLQARHQSIWGYLWSTQVCCGWQFIVLRSEIRRLADSFDSCMTSLFPLLSLPFLSALLLSPSPLVFSHSSSLPLPSSLSFFPSPHLPLSFPLPFYLLPFLSFFLPPFILLPS